ncbi:uncharacterized protein LOC116001177 [Ipomoea triloba]|uniref:uncharacterized protein LOC116001177 n=1 Tax=Ipomoea triloba TaxID=35885 RepID=UPI00125DAFD5|nr:uncharacterized protein LOC116001177 [Ipomoea triloba]
MECASTVDYHISHDGSLIGPIVPSRGLRQGDPISPYLFIIIAEGLSAMIKIAEDNGLLHGIQVARGAPKISHLLFVDDSFLFCKVAIPEIHSVNGVGNFSSYLGLPSLIGRNKKDILGFLKTRVLSKIRSWNHKFLSRAGKEVLIKSVIQALPTYAMSVFLIPKDIVRDIVCAINAFWWGTEYGNYKGICWKSWSRLCTPKDWGGIGFHQFDLFSKALLCKQVWRLIQNPSSLAARDAYVSSLFINNPLQWDSEIIFDIFNNRDASLITNIPLPISDRDDKLVWMGEDRGHFTVKSCYRLLMGEQPSASKLEWAILCKLKVPPKVKSFMWQECASCLPTADLLRAKKSVSMSGLHLKVWNNSNHSPASIVARATSHLKEWSSNHATDEFAPPQHPATIIKWKKPAPRISKAQR